MVNYVALAKSSFLLVVQMHCLSVMICIIIIVLRKFGHLYVNALSFCYYLYNYQ